MIQAATPQASVSNSSNVAAAGTRPHFTRTFLPVPHLPQSCDVSTAPALGATSAHRQGTVSRQQRVEGRRVSVAREGYGLHCTHAPRCWHPEASPHAEACQSSRRAVQCVGTECPTGCTCRTVCGGVNRSFRYHMPVEGTRRVPTPRATPYLRMCRDTLQLALPLAPVVLVGAVPLQLAQHVDDDATASTGDGHVRPRMAHGVRMRCHGPWLLHLRCIQWQVVHRALHFTHTPLQQLRLAATAHTNARR